MSDLALAIHADRVSRHYGSGKKKVSVLANISLSLPRGCVSSRARSRLTAYSKIYGLLGASGCGKTTLLKVIDNH
jgi:ABC-type lipoprotein export system ATPase subunit